MDDSSNINEALDLALALNHMTVNPLYDFDSDPPNLNTHLNNGKLKVEIENNIY